MNKNIAYRPSQSNQQYVKNSRGEKVLNGAYKRNNNFSNNHELNDLSSDFNNEEEYEEELELYLYDHLSNEEENIHGLNKREIEEKVNSYIIYNAYEQYDNITEKQYQNFVKDLDIDDVNDFVVKDINIVEYCMDNEENTIKNILQNTNNNSITSISNKNNVYDTLRNIEYDFSKHNYYWDNIDDFNNYYNKELSRSSNNLIIDFIVKDKFNEFTQGYYNSDVNLSQEMKKVFRDNFSLTTKPIIKEYIEKIKSNF